MTVMAVTSRFKVVKERKFDLSKTYRGPTTIATFDFAAYIPYLALGFPSASSFISGHLDTALATPPLRGKALSYTVESDTDPIIDKYRITLILAGSPEKEVSGKLEQRFGLSKSFPRADTTFPTSTFPQAIAIIPLVEILAVVGFLLIFGAITYRIAKGGVSGLLGVGTGGLIWVIVAGIGGLIAYKVVSRSGQSVVK